MRLDIQPTDRLHMLVWRSRRGDGTLNDWWLVAEAMNGVPLYFPPHFDTFEEALNAALRKAGLR